MDPGSHDMSTESKASAEGQLEGPASSTLPIISKWLRPHCAKTALQSSVLKNRESVYHRNVSPPRARTRGYPPSSVHTALPCSWGPRGSAARSITTRPPWGRGGEARPPARWQVRGAETGASEPVQGKRQNLNRFRRRDEPMALRFHASLL